MNEEEKVSRDFLENGARSVSDGDIVTPDDKSDNLQIKGYIRDSVTRTPIPNSKVIAINRETSQAREIQAGPNNVFHEPGYYELYFENNEEGIYDICVEKDGYFSLQQVVEVSGQQGLNFFLFKPF